MGNYLNPDINNFMEVVNSSIYVDKTELLEYLNSIAQTTQKYIALAVHAVLENLLQLT